MVEIKPLNLDLEMKLAKARWKLKEMIKLLNGPELFDALASVAELEKEAAELIEELRLADHHRLSQSQRPVFSRLIPDQDEKGLDSTFIHKFTFPNGHQVEGKFDSLFSWSTSELSEADYGGEMLFTEIPLSDLQRLWVDKERQPNAEHIQFFMDCIEQWISVCKLKSNLIKERESSPILSKQDFSNALGMTVLMFGKKAVENWALQPENKAKTKWSIDYSLIDPESKRKINIYVASLAKSRAKQRTDNRKRRNKCARSEAK